MGSFFSTPKPAALPQPEPVVTVDPVDEERKARIAAMNRARRGRSALIATSDQGLQDHTNPGHKKLLGD